MTVGRGTGELNNHSFKTCERRNATSSVAPHPLLFLSVSRKPPLLLYDTSLISVRPAPPLFRQQLPPLRPPRDLSVSMSLRGLAAKTPKHARTQ